MNMDGLGLDVSILDAESFDEIVVECLSPYDVISMFAQLRNSTISEEEQMNHLYTVMRNPMIVECIDELLYMFMDSPSANRAITHVLDGWQDVWTLNPSDHTRVYAQQTLVKKLKDVFTKFIFAFGEKDINVEYYHILQDDFMICLFHAG
jgi:hypothetical protein